MGAGTKRNGLQVRLWILLAGCAATAAGGVLFNEAIDALKRGDSPTAERKLRAELQSQPNEVEALSFLGVALDNQKKFAEADGAHRRALALAPRSNSILDKYANHQRLSGDESGARKTFLNALTLNAVDGYANLELGKMALKDKNGPEAISYLNRLSPAQQNEPDVAINRLTALELSGRHGEAGTVEAELLRKPDANVLYSLAYAYDSLNRPGDTLRILTRAAKLAPQRADILKSLAIAANNLREFSASVVAWNHVVELNPADDMARRERGFANAHLTHLDEAISDLNWYTKRHPDDPEGWYELGIAESAKDPTSGMSSLDKAVALKPDFAIARSARGALYYREGKPEAALPDLERAAALEPESAMIQYRLGQVYQALDRRSEALDRYRRAAGLAPNDYPAQFHYANALADAGKTAEADVILERIRTWPVKTPEKSPADLLDAR